MPLPLNITAKNCATSEYYFCEICQINLTTHLQGTREGSLNYNDGFGILFWCFNQNLWQRYEPKRFQQAFFLCWIRCRIRAPPPRVGVGPSFLCKRFHMMCMSSYSQELTSFCNLKSPANTQEHHHSVYFSRTRKYI